MSNKRLSRGRLFGIEKQGQEVDVSPSSLMKDAIVSATQHREGHKVVTDLVVDLGTSKANIKSGGITINDPIGPSGSTTDSVALCKVTDAVFGVVTSLEAVCLEAATDGVFTDFAFMSSSVGTATFGDNSTANGPITGSNAATTENSLATAGSHQFLTFDSQELKNKFIYIGAGSSVASAAPKGGCTITVNTESTGSIVGSITTIGLRTNDAESGTIVNLSASTTNAFGSSAVAGQFNVLNASSSLDIAKGLAIGINNNSNFTASPVDGTSATITVTHTNLAAANLGNQTNPGWRDAPGQTTDIVVSNFTGSHPNTLTSGKFLLRFTGFLEPEDL